MAALRARYAGAETDSSVREEWEWSADVNFAPEAKQHTVRGFRV
jgi:hypothetical protein